MVTLYIYDIRAENKKEFNKIKRKFYYHLGKIKNKSDFMFLSKSCILTEDEETFDNFFSYFKGDVSCFKIKTEQRIIKIS